jgi:hypothetical protein
VIIQGDSARNKQKRPAPQSWLQYPLLPYCWRKSCSISRLTKKSSVISSTYTSYTPPNNTSRTPWCTRQSHRTRLAPRGVARAKRSSYPLTLHVQGLQQIQCPPAESIDCRRDRLSDHIFSVAALTITKSTIGLKLLYAALGLLNRLFNILATPSQVTVCGLKLLYAAFSCCMRP